VRYLILSDIHANWEALEAILSHAGGHYDQIVCCGDIVGYGADPNAATDWVRDNVTAIVRGNHDKAVYSSEGMEWFNPAARHATEWTQREMSAGNLVYLGSLQKGPIWADDFQLAHGSPMDEDDYVVEVEEAAQLYGYLDSAVTFFGHTHMQGGFLLHRNGTRRINQVQPDEHILKFKIEEDFACLINPGSAGQPRDGDPRAAYAIYVSDERLVIYHRIGYDIEKAQQKIIQAGLPHSLAQRLAKGR